MSYEYNDSYDLEELIDTLNNKISKIADLEAKLAEKTLTIERINKAFIENRSLWKGKYEQANQDKISFCIEQLNLLYKTLTTEDTWRAMKKGWWLNNGECLQLRKTIDNQIEAIKEGK